MIVRLIADRTEVVGKLVLYPFIVLLLMFFSRSSFFDYLDYPWPLILIQGLMFLALVVSALLLHYQAIRAREQVLENLRGSLAFSKGIGDVVREEQIGQLARDIRQEHKGAFTPLTRHPLLKALAIPTGGASALVILENFLG